MTNESTESNKNHLGMSKETVDQIRRQILFGEAVEPPKNSSRFQKGTSGNPKGRPKKKQRANKQRRSAILRQDAA